jgi:hypothetical protein
MQPLTNLEPSTLNLELFSALILSLYTSTKINDLYRQFLTY